MGCQESWELSAAEAAGLIRAGRVTSVELVEGCLARIRDTEPRVGAWIYLDPEYALAQTKAADKWRFPVWHVWLFGRTIEDLALLLEEVAGHDERDPDTHPRGRGSYRAVAMAEPPIEPRFGFFRSGRWDRIAEDAQAALGEVVEHLGGRVEELELSASADELAEWHRVIMDSEVAVNLRREWETGHDRLSAPLRTRIAAGHAVRAPEYLAAQAAAGPILATFTELFEQRYDAILTPAVDGTAPAGLESTGEYRTP